MWLLVTFLNLLIRTSVPQLRSNPHGIPATNSPASFYALCYIYTQLFYI